MRVNDKETAWMVAKRIFPTKFKRTKNCVSGQVVRLTQAKMNPQSMTSVCLWISEIGLR